MIKKKIWDVAGGVSPLFSPRGMLGSAEAGPSLTLVIEVNLSRFRASTMGSDGFLKILTSKERFFIAF
jgi:hypothetical protein